VARTVIGRLTPSAPALSSSASLLIDSSRLLSRAPGVQPLMLLAVLGETDEAAAWAA